MKSSRTPSKATISITALLISFAAYAGPYEQHENIVYGETHGIGLLMDIFVPTGEKNGLAIVDVTSGAWYSDRGKINDHKMAQVFDIYCEKGYTVFAVRPGSRTKFTGEEMLAHVQRGIQWVKAHANEYEIDPDRIGITGGSAGGHLATLAALSPIDGNADSNDPVLRQSSAVAAAGVFFPPTDFLKWGEEPAPLDRIGPLLYADGINGRSDEEVREKARQLSPVHLVSEPAVPFIIWHGDADPLVPLQQSEDLVATLKEAGTDVEFHVKEGGGHPWLTIPEEVAHMAEWFDRKLGAS